MELIMSRERFDSFDEFWPYYLQEHSNPTNRTLHVAGTVAAAVTLGAAVVTRRPRLAALSPLIGYGAAWIGHFMIEKNRPATFTHPLWSLQGDLKMAQLALTGQLDDELRRLGISDQNKLR